MIRGSVGCGLTRVLAPAGVVALCVSVALGAGAMARTPVGSLAVSASVGVGPSSVGALTVPAGAGEFGFGPLAVADRTAVVGGEESTGGYGARGVLSVFVRPGQAWGTSSSVATLRASDGGAGDMLGYYVGSVGIAGRTIAAGAPSVLGAGSPVTPRSGAVYVFAEPASGWSGSLREAAKLIPSPAARCVEPFAVAVASRTIATSCSRLGTSAPEGEVLVFSEPAGGWSGALPESARLLPAGRSRLWVNTSVAISGRFVIADGTNASGTQGVISVFREPVNGWTGSVRPAATLSAAKGVFFSPVAVSGRMIFAASNAYFVDRHGRASVYAFAEPRRGWSGRIQPIARLRYASAADATGPSLAASHGSVVLAWTEPSQECPCSAWLNRFVEPARGWKGTLATRWTGHLSTSTGSIGLAIGGSTILASDGTQVALFR